MVTIKAVKGSAEVTMMGNSIGLISELMSCNRAFYNALKERDEIVAELFKGFMIKNVAVIFDDVPETEENDDVDSDKLDELLDKAQELIDKLREQE